MASWLVLAYPDAAVVRGLAVYIVLCSWQDTTLAVPLSTQMYKWVPSNLMLRVTLRWTSIPSSGENKILLVASCYGNRDKLWPDEPFGSYADLTFTYSKLTFSFCTHWGFSLRSACYSEEIRLERSTFGGHHYETVLAAWSSFRPTRNWKTWHLLQGQ